MALPALLKPPAVARLQPADYPTESPKVVQGLIHKDSLQMLEDGLRTHLTRQFPHREFKITGDIYVHPVGASNLAPDVIVYLQQPDMQGRDSFNIEEHGAPDLVIEVLSGTTWSEDLRIKKGRYAAMGIAEYWVHDPKGLRPVGSPVVQGFQLEGGQYIDVVSYHSVVEGRDVELYYSSVLQTEWGADVHRAMRLYNPATGQWYKVLADKDKELADKDKVLADKDKELADKDKVLADKDKELAQFRVLLREYGIDPDAQATQRGDRENGTD